MFGSQAEFVELCSRAGRQAPVTVRLHNLTTSFMPAALCVPTEPVLPEMLEPQPQTTLEPLNPNPN